MAPSATRDMTRNMVASEPQIAAVVERATGGPWIAAAVGTATRSRAVPTTTAEDCQTARAMLALDRLVERLEEASVKLGDFTRALPVRPADTEVPPPLSANAPAASVKRWRKRPPRDDIEAAAHAVAKTYSPDNKPTQAEWWKAFNAQFPKPVARRVALSALDEHAEHLKRRPGEAKRRPGQTKRNRQS